MSRRVNIFRALGPSCADSDVNNFFAISDLSEASLSSWLSAIGKTYAEVKAYTCEFITAIKAAGITGVNSAMYLPIGNTADQRKWNFWNPVDSDAAFRMTFNGGISFTNFGIVGNGINGFSNTYWVPLDQASASEASFAIDSGSDISGSNMIMGVATSNRYMFINLGALPNGNIQIATGGAILYSGTRKGLFVSRRDGLASNESFRDGVSLGTTTRLFNPPQSSFYLNAVNTNGSAAFYATHPVNFAYISPQGWSDVQVAALQSAYEQLKSDLGIL